MINNSIIINLIALAWPVISAFRERHYVRRDSAIFNGLSLIGVGVGILILSPSLNFLNIPLAAFPLIIGIAGIAFTSSRNEWGTRICSGLVTSIILVVILLIQLSQLGISTI